MSTKFRWHTEEDPEWDDGPLEVADPENRAGARRLRLILIGFLILALAAGGFLSYRQLTRRVEATTSQVAADVMASFEVIRRAADNRDGELFSSVLSGRDAGWTAAQQRLTGEGLLFDRPVLNLSAGAIPAAVPANVQLADDLLAAELQLPVNYTVDVGNGITDSVTLVQTQLFRRGSDRRWLLSPPFADFWGEWESISGGRLTVTYPTRDAAVVTRLASDLNRKLEEGCRLDTVSCPPALSLDLRFSIDPLSMLNGRDLAIWLTPGQSVELPTPTLVGLPQDQAGYSALLRGYGAALVRILLLSSVEGDCCAAPLYVQAALDFQLDRLGLQPWPVAWEDYGELLRRDLMLSELTQLWWRNPFDAARFGTEWPLAYAALEFAQLTSGRLTSLAEAAAGAGSFAEADDAAWRLFLAERHRELQPAGARAPAVTAEFLCLLPQQAGVVSHRFDTATGALSERTLIAADGLAFPIEGQEAFAFVTSDGAALFREGQAPLQIQVDGLADADPVFVLDSDRPERMTVLFTGAQGLVPVAVDTTNCHAAGCVGSVLPGLPVWSPDGSHAVTLSSAVIRSDGGRLRTLEQPLIAAAWIDNETFVYGVAGKVFLSSVERNESTLLVDVADALNEGLEERQNPRMAIHQIAATADAVWFTANTILFAGSPRRGALFRYDLEEGRIEELYQLEGHFQALEPAPDRTRLLAVSEPTTFRPGYLAFFLWDMEALTSDRWITSGITSIGYRFWSPDGNWLLIPGHSHSRLFHPDSGAIELIRLGGANGCYANAWPASLTAPP